MSHRLDIFRDAFSAQASVGKMYITPVMEEKEYFCESLEDTVRPNGIKVKGHTAIPAGVEMKIDIRYSPKFKREMLVLYTHKVEKEGEATRYYIRHEGIEWGEAMFHGGNDNTHTEGCPLVAYNRLSSAKIQGTAESELFARVKALMETCDVTAMFHNGSQKN